MTQGHLLIATDSGQYVTPAAFVGNGLAVHRGIASDPGFAITHVRSGLKLRGGLNKPVADEVGGALAKDDWTFDKGAVTIAHADRLRALASPTGNFVGGNDA